jgi:sec-independent protein translocase protein TatC
VIGLLVSFVLIIFSFYYSYYRIIPLSVRFLTSSHFIPVDVGMLLNYNRNIFYILQFIFITLVVFQTPIILEILLIMNVVQRRTLLLISRYVIVGIFVLSAIITPPDFISQISLTVPLVGLYFLTILIAWIFKFGEE